ncbi:MAG: tail fiber domain-containing protein, partial [Chloroflexi bacterium]|nr:tail fiber domain-containing protein [Chloroflexota bacterium]
PGALGGRLFIDGVSGNVGIGATTPGAKLQVGNSGDGTVARANSWLGFSDERYKTGIAELENASELVAQLEGVRFNWKESGEASIGFVAQDVAEVLPELVHADEAGYLSVDYTKMTPVLVEALQEQQATITTLQEQNDQMALELADIQAQLAVMDSSPARFPLSGLGWSLGFILLAGIGLFVWQRQEGNKR